jgi:hypothetical protein
MDNVGFHMEVFRMIIPDDWQCYGGITWQGDTCVGMPTILRFAIMSPEGSKALEVFPDYIFSWVENRWSRTMVQMPEGAFVKVGPPMDPEQAILDWLLRQQRRQIEPYRVVSHSQLPQTERMFWFGGAPPLQEQGASYRFGKVRIAYDVHGIPMEEEFWANVGVGQRPLMVQGMQIPVTYTVLKTFSCRARAGELDENYDTFSRMVHSLTHNPQFAQRSREFTFQKVAEAEANSQRVMEWSRQMSAANDQWLQQQAQRREIASREFEANRQRYNDRLEAERIWSQKQSNATLGQETVINPHTGQEQQIEGGHVDAYINNLGQILYSDTYGYNPNERLSGNWTRMDRAF